MSYTQAGGSNTFIADLQSTGNLTIEFSRNPKSFPHLQYSEVRPVTKARGYFNTIKAEQAARVTLANGQEYAWPPGNDSPTGTDNQEQFQFLPYFAQRYANAVRMDNLAVEQSAWPVAETEIRAKAQQAMTLRTQKLATALSGASWGGNTAAVTSSTLAGSGHHFGNGTVAAPYIMTSLQAAAIIINQATLGVIEPKDLVFVVDPVSASLMAQTAEIRGYLANSVYAYPAMTGTLPGAPAMSWGLPPLLYGFRTVVEDTIVVTSNRDATSPVFTYPIPKGTAYLLARRDNEMVNPTILKVEEGKLKLTDEQREQVPVFSTVCGFFMEEMTTENRVEPWQRRTDVRITNHYDYKVTNPVSGFRFTSTFG